VPTSSPPPFASSSSSGCSLPHITSRGAPKVESRHRCIAALASSYRCSSVSGGGLSLRVHQAEEKSSLPFRTWIEVKCKHRSGVVLCAAALFLQAEDKTVSLLLQVIHQIRRAVSSGDFENLQICRCSVLQRCS
jgi:hypothetical protein